MSRTHRMDGSKLSTRAYNALNNMNVLTTKQARSMGYMDFKYSLLKLRGVGKKTYIEVMEWAGFNNERELLKARKLARENERARDCVNWLVRRGYRVIAPESNAKR